MRQMRPQGPAAGRAEPSLSRSVSGAGVDPAGPDGDLYRYIRGGAVQPGAATARHAPSGADQSRSMPSGAEHAFHAPSGAVPSRQAPPGAVHSWNAPAGADRPLQPRSGAGADPAAYGRGFDPAGRQDPDHRGQGHSNPRDLADTGAAVAAAPPRDAARSAESLGRRPAETGARAEPPLQAPGRIAQPSPEMRAVATGRMDPQFSGRTAQPAPAGPATGARPDPAAGARYWQPDPAAASRQVPGASAVPAQASPVAATRVAPGRPIAGQPSKAALVDDEGPFRPWLHPDPEADAWSAAAPGAAAFHPAAVRPGAPALGGAATGHAPRTAGGLDAGFGSGSWPQPEAAPRHGAAHARDVGHESHQTGPWDDGWSAEAPRAGSEAGWDQLYSEPGDTDRVQVFAPEASRPEAETVPEAPMMDARPARRDPAPSRTVYRLQRMWLTPLYQALLRKGLPAFVLVFGLGFVLQDEGRRQAISDWAGNIRASVTERPEFMVASLRIEGASDETADAVRRALDMRLPVSSFDIELAELQQRLAGVDSIASAALHVRPGGVLEVLVQERRPAVVWRSDTGIGTLDQTGHLVSGLQNRLERPDLPLLVGTGAEAAVPEALRLYHAAGPIRDRVRGLIRVGERRWDLVVEPSIRVMLPAKDPVPALEQVVALHEAQSLLDRDITAVDLRNPSRATVRMGEPAADTWRINLAAQRGAPRR